MVVELHFQVNDKEANTNITVFKIMVPVDTEKVDPEVTDKANWP
jgi:hypothetical protein